MARYDLSPSDFDVAGARIGIVAARFNDEIVSRLLEAALDTLARHGLDRDGVPVVRVPGAFELPLAARWLATCHGPPTDSGSPGRSREGRRIVHEAGIPDDEPGGKNGTAAGCPPMPATSAGRGRDGASPAARGWRGAAILDAERAGGDDVAARGRRGAAVLDAERAGGDDMAARGLRGAAVLDAEHAGGDDMAARERRGATIPDDERIGEDSGPHEEPLIERNAITAGNVAADAIIALGAVIRGDTPHFDYVCAEAARGILAVSLELDVPVVFGVLTCDDYGQARERAGFLSARPIYVEDEKREYLKAERRNKGREAALAALEMVSLRRRLGA